MSTTTKSPPKSEKSTHAAAPARTPAQPHGPATATAAGFELAQQSAGNQAIQQLLNAGVIRAKLSISQPNDPDEQEADAVADRIMRMPDTAVKPPCPTCATGAAPCQTCSEGRSNTIHRKASSNASHHSSTAAHHILSRLGSGHPLDKSTRDFFEPRLGSDLSHVRVHTGSNAAESARSIQARAYTLGSSIVFDQGEYTPNVLDGKKLLAHEIVHALQGSTTGTSDIIQRQGAPLPPTAAADDAATKIATAVRDGKVGDTVPPLRGKSVGELQSIRSQVNAQTNIWLERWLITHKNRADSIRTARNVIGGGATATLALINPLAGAATYIVGKSIPSPAADGTAEEGIRILLPALPLIDRLELYDEGYREIEQAQLDVIRSANADERQVIRSETVRLEAIYSHMGVKEEYDARVLIDPEKKYVAAECLLKRAPGVISDDEDLVFDAIWVLTPTERTKFYKDKTLELHHLLSADRFKLLGTLATGSEAEALIARLRLATEGRIDDQEAVQAVVDRAIALLGEQNQLRATLAVASLPPEELSKAQSRLNELGELASLLKFGSGRLAPESFLGRLAESADSPDAFGAMALQLGATITDPKERIEFSFRAAKQRILMAASVTGANEDSVRNAILELRAPPIVDAVKLTPVERDQKQAEANAKLRQRLLDDVEVKSVISSMPTSAGMRVRSFVTADPFIERLTELTLALNAARWGEFFQIVLQIAMRPDWKARFEDTSKNPFDTFARVHGEQREIMLDILKNKRIPTDKILGFTGNVEVLKTALANIDEGERGQLRTGYLIHKTGRKPTDKTEEDALAAYKVFEANLNKSQTTLKIVDKAGVEAVLDAALGAEPTAKELETGTGRYNAAALMYERQQAHMALGTGGSAYFTETDETMLAAAREFASRWMVLRERTPHELTTLELGVLSELHNRFNQRSEEFSDASNTAGEVAGMVAATIAGIIVVAATGGVTAPAVVAAAAAGGTARVVTREMFGEDYYNPAGGEGARDAVLGGIDAALAVIGASLGARGAELLGLGGKAFVTNAARIGGEVAEQASSKLAHRVAAGAVEAAIDGAFSGFISEAANAMTDARTWRRGVWQGLMHTGQAALIAGLTGLAGGGIIGGAIPVASRGARWALESAAGMRIETALISAGAGDTLAAAQRAARAGDVKVLDEMIAKLEGHLNNDEAALLRRRLYSDVESTLGHPPGRADAASPEQARLLAETAAIESDLNAAQRTAEFDVIRRSEPQPSALDGYVDEVDLGNGHTWRRRSDNTWCRFTKPSLCGTKIPNAPPLRARVRVSSSPPHGYRLIKIDYPTLPRDALGNIAPLPEGVIYEFPGGHRVWREGEVIRHDSVLGPSTGRRSTETEIFSAGESGRPEIAGMERAHTLGQGTGFESPFGIFYAPREVNQIIQNNGLEELFRGLRDSAGPNEAFHVSTLTVPHPGSLRLREIRYRVELARNGKNDFMFEYVINVGNDVPNPSVTHGVANITENQDIAQYFDRVDVPERLRTRFARFAH